MSWRDSLRKASFRGVEFDVVGNGASFGRRTALHEFPFRDLPYSEDLGRKAREIRIDGFILGDDYITRVNALIDAIEQPGSGKLVHPTLGELTVSVSQDGLSVEQSVNEGGMARVSFSCIESGEARFPTASAATQDVLKAAADSATGFNLDSFVRRFSLAGVPGWAQQLSIGRAQAFLDQLRSAIAPLANFAGGRGSVLGLLDLLVPGISTLLLTSRSFASSVSSLLGTTRRAVDAPTAVRVLGAVGSGYAVGDTHLQASTPTRIREAANRDAMVEFIRAAVVIERARAVADLVFTDYQHAIRIRDSVTEQIDMVAEVTADDILFDTLTALRAAVVRDIAARGADLARLVSVSPETTKPALVLAHDLYQDASRDADILARNRIVHPGFVPAGQTLEVPADA